MGPFWGRLPKSSWQVASIEGVSASGALEWEAGCD